MAGEFKLVQSPRLSIVVPVVADTAAMEETLVSILEHRPGGCEIVVVLGCEYADPWNIREEVRFVQAPQGSGLVACVNLGLAASGGEVVHVLGAGWRATEGWTDRPLARFEDDAVAAVVPIGVAADDRDRVVSAGVRYAVGGRRIDVAAEAARSQRRPTTPKPQGPVLEAGFWRADALGLTGRGFTTACGAAGADADMAVTISRAGLGVVFEPRSVVVAAPEVEGSRAAGGFSEGLHAERLFWRSLAGSSPVSAVMHLVEIARHAVAVAPLGSIPMLLGRVVAVLQFGGFVQRYLQLRRVVREAAVDRRPQVAVADRDLIRIDGQHAGMGRPRAAEPSVLRKSA